jgi:hypothetical protein
MVLIGLILLPDLILGMIRLGWTRIAGAIRNVILEVKLNVRLFTNSSKPEGTTNRGILFLNQVA